MWTFVNSMPLPNLDLWYRWLTIFAIGLPILGAIMGGLCGWGAFIVSSRIGDLQSAEVRRAEQTAKDAAERATELDRLRQPRHLTDSQEIKLYQFLVNAPKGNVTLKASVTAPDARGYADEIAAVFKRAGWNAPVDNALFTGGDTSGISITVRGATIPEVAQTVYSALKGADIEINEGARGDENGPAADDAWLEIGAIK